METTIKRYSDEDLEEFKQIILKKLEQAKKKLTENIVIF